MQQTLFLMLGYPGAGKTTVAKIVHKLTGAEHLWADHVRRKMYQQPSYSHLENMHLYTHLNDLTNELLADGKSVIFDTNFNFYSDRKHLGEIASKQNAQVIIVWVKADKKLAKQRATVDAHLQKHTRVLGNMPIKQFDRISNNLELPRADEKVIELDGTKIDDDYVSQKLYEAGISRL